MLKVIAGHFKSLSDALEIKARTDSVNEKITYAGEMQSTLRQLLTEVSIPYIPSNRSYSISSRALRTTWKSLSSCSSPLRLSLCVASLDSYVHH